MVKPSTMQRPASDRVNQKDIHPRPCAKNTLLSLPWVHLERPRIGSTKHNVEACAELYFTAVQPALIKDSLQTGASHWADFSRWGAPALGSAAKGSAVTIPGSRAQTQQLWLTGLAAPRRVGSSRTRDRTHDPGVGRGFLSTAPIPELLFKPPFLTAFPCF